MAAASLAVVLAAVACSPLQDTRSADAGIADFHQKLDTEDFAGIYAAASPAMKAAMTQDALVRILTFVHQRLGPFRSGHDVGWNDNVNTGGHFLSISYAAKYDRGVAAESFVYRIDGGCAQLVSFNISSQALLPY
jgi:hypothetical protein